MGDLFGALTVFQSVVSIAAAFAVGACAGSFMDVVRSRGSWRASLRGRSRCVSCESALTWHCLIPIFSHLALRGRCASCSKKIPARHLFAEAATGSLFVLALLTGGSIWSAAALLLAALFLVPIVSEDVASMEVPERLSLPFAYLSLCFAVAFALSFGSIAPFVSGLVLAAPFALLWLCSRGRAIGLGDAKVAVAMGLLVADPVRAVSVFLFSFWIGSAGVVLYALWLLLRGRSVRVLRGMRVPFVPCMALAFVLVLTADLSVRSVFGGLISIL